MMCPDLCNGMGPGPGFSAKPMGDHRIIAPWWSLANQVKGYQYISVIIKNIQKELVRTFSVRVLNFLNLEVAPIDFQTSLPSQKKSLRCKQQHMFQAHQDQSHWSWLRKTDQELPWLICKASKTHMDWWFKDVYTTHKKMLSNWGWSILLPHIDLNIIVWYSYINILLDIMIEKLNFYTYLYINIYELLIWVEYSDCFPILIGSPLQSSGSFLTASVVWVLHSASHLPQKSGWDGMPDKVRIIADFSDLDSQRTREKKKWIISHSKFRIISQRLFTILSCEIFARCHLALNLVNLFILFPPRIPSWRSRETGSGVLWLLWSDRYVWIFLRLGRPWGKQERRINPRQWAGLDY